MRRLLTRDVKPDMRLALPVKDHYGVLLLGKGVDLTPKSIRLLKSWGVPEVYVEGKADPETAEPCRLAKQIARRVADETARRFQETQPDSYMEEIRRAAAEILERRYMETAPQSAPSPGRPVEGRKHGGLKT